MYKELIKRLKDYSTARKGEIAEMTEEAADAIEQLSNAGSAYGRGWTLGYDAGRAESKPRWIPVTERLPEAESGDTSKPVLITDGDCMAIAEWFNFELCEPYWSYTGTGDITHWMPLPEPPKEGME